MSDAHAHAHAHVHVTCHMTYIHVHAHVQSYMHTCNLTCACHMCMCMHMHMRMSMSHVHAYVCVPSSKCLEAWRRSPPAAPRRSLQLLAFHAVLTLATYASYSHLRFLLTYAGTAGARLHALPLHVHRLVPRDPRASHGRGAAWAAPQLGSCAS